MMNLTELFEVQRKLDAEIERKHPAEPEENRLADKILALQVEVGECANEWRGFKFWSDNRSPRTKGEWIIGGHGKLTNPLLEEYVDCLHFILSIGLDIKCTTVACDVTRLAVNVNEQFRGLNYEIASFDYFRSLHNFHNVLSVFKGLGEMLGFTWEQVTEAYMSKNKINYERQANGY